MNWLKKLFAFASVGDTVKGLINQEELFKSIGAALTSGGIVGGLLSLLVPFLTMVSANAAMIFPNPIVATLATTLLTLVVQLIGRSAHGETPTILPPGARVPQGGALAPAPEDLMAAPRILPATVWGGHPDVHPDAPGHA